MLLIVVNTYCRYGICRSCVCQNYWCLTCVRSTMEIADICLNTAFMLASLFHCSLPLSLRLPPPPPPPPPPPLPPPSPPSHFPPPTPALSPTISQKSYSFLLNVIYFVGLVPVMWPTKYRFPNVFLLFCSPFSHEEWKWRYNAIRWLLARFLRSVGRSVGFPLKDVPTPLSVASKGMEKDGRMIWQMDRTEILPYDPLWSYPLRCRRKKGEKRKRKRNRKDVLCSLWNYIVWGHGVISSVVPTMVHSFP